MGLYFTSDTLSYRILNYVPLLLLLFVSCQRDEGFHLDRPLQKYFRRFPVEVQCCL